MKKVIKATLASLAFLTSGVFGGEAEVISMVKKGSLGACRNYTLEEVVNNFMEKPKWKHTVDKNGIDYVTVSGITSSGRPANVAMQFWVRKKEFGYQASEIDGVPQNVLEVVVLTNEMCESASKAEKAAKEEKFSKIRVIPAEPINDSRDGKKYKTVKIGNQTWMAENLNIKIGNSKCYENKEDNCKKYGRLYDWKTAMKSCPSGWHLPVDKEWNELYRYVNDTDNGTKYLRAKSGWEGQYGSGEDKFGFSALPGGFGISDGDFGDVGKYGGWWSANEFSVYCTDDRGMSCRGDMEDFWDSQGMSYLHSVRCIQD